MIILTILSAPLLACIFVATRLRHRRAGMRRATMFAAAVPLVLVPFLVSEYMHGTLAPFTSLFVPDALSVLLMSILAVVGFATAIHAGGHIKVEEIKGIIGFTRVRQYYFLSQLFLFALSVAALTTNPLLAWVAVEATTLSTVLLTSMYGKDSDLEAGWKQLIITSVGMLIGLLGTLLFLSVAATAGAASSLVSWKDLILLAPHFDPTLTKVAFIFVLVGYGTKIGLVPLHTWKPDAYSKAPSPISALFSGALLSAAMVILLRFRHLTTLAIGAGFSSTLLIAFGIISIVVSALLMTGPTNFKRLLAYSSIEHAGVMVLGFGAGGVGLVAGLYHMIYHALAKPVLFFTAGNFVLKYHSSKIAKVRGALSIIPVSAIGFLAGIFAATGLPPFGIFFTKLTILSAIMQHSPIVAFVALVAFAVVFANLLHHAATMLFGKAPEGIIPGEAHPRTVASFVFLGLVFIVLSFWVPATLSALINEAATLIS